MKQALADFNSQTSAYVADAGQRVDAALFGGGPNEYIPPADAWSGNGATAAPQTYAVQSSDSLFRIAQQNYSNGNLYPIIAAANGISDSYSIQTGQQLVIPDASAYNADAVQKVAAADYAQHAPVPAISAESLMLAGEAPLEYVPSQPSYPDQAIEGAVPGMAESMQQGALIKWEQAGGQVASALNNAPGVAKNYVLDELANLGGEANLVSESGIPLISQARSLLHAGFGLDYALISAAVPDTLVGVGLGVAGGQVLGGAARLAPKLPGVFGDILGADVGFSSQMGGLTFATDFGGYLLRSPLIPVGAGEMGAFGIKGLRSPLVNLSTDTLRSTPGIVFSSGELSPASDRW